ncbi:glycerophosphodiester phosphodiesterase [Streptomyces sp. NPDC002308]
MTTVKGKLIGPKAPERTEVTFALVDVTGAAAVGYVAGDEAEIVRPVTVRPNTDGTWETDLIPNAQVEALAGDTVWAVMEGRALDGTPVLTHIVVPEGDGTWWVGDLRVDLSDTPAGGGTLVYVPGPAGVDGRDGADGTNGIDGQDGTPGASAYEVWLDAGHTGTEVEFLSSLVGPSGTAEAREYTDDAVAAEAVRADAAYDPAGTAATAAAGAVSTAAADATAKADAARVAAVSAAATDASTKVSTAQAAAISAAAADATTKAAAAQAAAATDASTKANNAQTAATNAAAADATAKANAARTAATSAAAADATTKANAAQTAAISAAAVDATTKASTAQSNAISTAATSAATLYLPNAITTIDAYMAGATTASPRYFAHRGGGMVRPEHTLAAYRAAAAQGWPLELSANLDASGTLWCIHDATLDRTTNRTGALNTYTSEEVAQLVTTANAKPMFGPGWAEQPLVTIRQVLDEFLGRVPIFIEAKGTDAVAPLQNLLTTRYPHAPRSVIWKAPVTTTTLPWAKGLGYRTWAYMDGTTADATLNALDASVDYWGVQTTMTDARITQIVARGKPVFAWPVYRRTQRDRLLGLGVVGLMSSDPGYVSTTTATRTSPRWDLGVKESGGTPALDYDAGYALQYGTGADAGWVSVAAVPNQSYGLGAESPVVAGAGGYRITWDMKFKVLPALTTEHAGLYFGKAADDVYRFGTANASGGYHVVIRANGQMQLNRHTAGTTTGATLGTAQNTTAPVADTAMSFQLDVTPTTVELRRTDGTGWTTGPIADVTYRGGYFGLSNGSVTDVSTRPWWRNLTVAPL